MLRYVLGGKTTFRLMVLKLFWKNKNRNNLDICKKIHKEYGCVK